MSGERHFEITGAMVRAAWANLPSPYEIDTGDDGAMREMVGAIFVTVLQAIREPSDVMNLAGAAIIADVASVGDCSGPAPDAEFADDAKCVWQAMIDAAMAD